MNFVLHGLCFQCLLKRHPHPDVLGRERERERERGGVSDGEREREKKHKRSFHNHSLVRSLRHAETHSHSDKPFKRERENDAIK